MTSSRPERKRRPIWILPAIAGAFYILGGLIWALTVAGCSISACISGVNSALANSANPVPSTTPAAAVSVMVSSLEGAGLDLLFFGAILVVVASTGLRGGFRWAWYVLLMLFLYGLADLVTGLDLAPWAFADVVLVGVGLALSYKSTFRNANIRLTVPPRTVGT